MAESAVSFAIEQLGSLLVQEYGLLKNFRTEVRYIKDEFNSIKALLKDADKKGELADGEQVKLWLKDLRHAAFDIEDVLEEYLFRHLTKQAGEQQAGVHGYGTCGFIYIKYFFTKLMERHNLASRIQEIKVRIENISKRKEKYNLINLNQDSTTTASTSSVRDPRQDALFVDEAKVVGISKPKEELTRWLTEKPEDPRTGVLSVFGPGGLGKTTLVRKVYESETVKSRFPVRCWITVSQNCDSKRLLKELILATLATYEEEKKKTKEEEEEEKREEEKKNGGGGKKKKGGEKKKREEEKKKMEEGEKKLRDLIPQLEHMEVINLKEILRNCYKDKRYLIVMDDIWDSAAWKEMRTPLPDSGCASRIIVTTRDRDIANSCIENSDYAYELKPLSREHSSALFHKVAFKSEKNYSSDKHLREVIQKFLYKCGGLPLAIVAMAGLLSSKQPSEWEKIYTDNDSLSQLSDVNYIFSLSYNDLPYHLKACLLYLCIFPEDYVIKCSELLPLWVAEGFINSSMAITKEEVAERHLDELIARSLIQVQDTDISGAVKTCRIHDLLRDFILKKAHDQEFAEFWTKWSPDGDIDKVRRRLSLFNTKEVADNTLPSSLLQIRSLFIFGNVCHNTISKLLSGGSKLLKVLHVEGDQLKGFSGDELITNLFFLRHLHLNLCGTPILRSLGKLVNLETLDLGNKYKYDVELPVEILKLTRLRNVLGACFLLPKEIGRLAALENLDCANGARGIDGAEVAKLTQLRSLRVWKLQAKDGTAVLASTAKMEYLHTLQLRTDDKSTNCFEEQNLNLKVNCSRSLRRLSLTGIMKDNPDWILSLEKLSKLVLCNSKIKDSSFFGRLQQKLPRLVELKLQRNALEVAELCFAKGSFPKLRLLEVSNLSKLKSIKIEQGAMPSLLIRAVYDCPSIRRDVHVDASVPVHMNKYAYKYKWLRREAHLR